jgi:hypothetical protein
MAVPSVFLNGEPFGSAAWSWARSWPRSTPARPARSRRLNEQGALRRADRRRRPGRRRGRGVCRAQGHPHRHRGRALRRPDAGHAGHRELHLGAGDRRARSSPRRWKPMCATTTSTSSTLQRVAGAGAPRRSPAACHRGAGERRRAEGRTRDLATGARWRNVERARRAEYRTKGVAYCPHCDGPLFKGKDVAVIGGGNSGVEAAIDLAGVVASVTVLEFADQLKADAVLVNKLQEPAQRHHPPERADAEITGDGQKVNGLRFKDRTSGRDHARSGRRVRADRPGAQHRVPQGHGGAEPLRRDRGRRPRRHQRARRVRRRRRDHGAVQADRHRRR